METTKTTETAAWEVKAIPSKQTFLVTECRTFTQNHTAFDELLWVSKALSCDPRGSLEALHVAETATEGVLQITATDGRILSRIETDRTGLTPGFWVVTRKLKTTLELAKVKDGELPKYPNCDMVLSSAQPDARGRIPAGAECNNFVEALAHIFRNMDSDFGIDPALVERVWKDGARVTSDKAEHPGAVLFTWLDKSVALVMPLRMNKCL